MKTIKLSSGKGTGTEEAKKYRHIRSWGVYMRSYEYYIKSQQERAARDGAPEDALYYQGVRGNGGSGWVCASELEPGHNFLKFHEDFWSAHK